MARICSTGNEDTEPSSKSGFLIGEQATRSYSTAHECDLHLDADELDDAVLSGLRKTFGQSRLENAVRGGDETEYLLASPANYRHLMDTLADVEAEPNVVQPEQGAFR